MSLFDYLDLLKPKVTGLNVFAGVTGLLLASNMEPQWVTLGIFLAVGFLAVGGCGAVNSFLDRDIDDVMPRTAPRPLPSNKIKPPIRALYLGVGMIGGAVTLSALLLNFPATLLILSGAAIYLIIYTLWLKRRTPWNIVVGGLAGSFAPLTGWASVTGTLALPALMLGLLIFLWTPGHFWSLATKMRSEYGAAGIPMLPVILGDTKGARWAATASLTLTPLPFLFYYTGLAGFIFLGFALPLTCAVVYANLRLYSATSEDWAWRSFKLSNLYLGALLVAILVDAMIL